MGRIGMILFSEYLDDPRPRREAEVLVRAGFHVDIICIGNRRKKKKEIYKGVNIYRININHVKSSKIRYLWEYSFFIFSSFIYATLLDIKKKYNIIFIHNMPDIMIISAIIPKIFGAKTILDLHDPMPELFGTIYSVTDRHPMIVFLKFLEKVSISLADLVITPNISFRNLFISRGCLPEKIKIIMNTPQEDVFKTSLIQDPGDTSKAHRPFSLMLHGIIEERQGQDLAVRAMSALRDRIPCMTLHIYGDGRFSTRVREIVSELDLGDRVMFHGSIPLEQIANALAEADVVLVPNRRNPFTELNFPTRIFEALRMEKPVIAPRTQGILDYFDEDSLFFFEPGSAEDLAAKIFEVYSNPLRTRQIVEKGKAVYLQHTWKTQGERLVALVKGLL